MLRFKVGRFVIPTLEFTRKWVLENLDEGVECPCCGQFCKIYKRSMNAGMLQTMLIVKRKQANAGYMSKHEVDSDSWVYLPAVKQRSRDFATLQYFGFVEQKPGVRDDGAKQTGWWRVTPAGILFLRGATQTQKYRKVYNNKVVGTEGKLVSISDVWTNFDYRELIS